MTIKIDNEDDLNSFTLVHIAIRFRLFDSLFSSFLKALSMVSGYDWWAQLNSSQSAYHVTRDIGDDLRTELLDGIDWFKGEGERLVSLYIDEIKKEFPDLVEDVDIYELANGIWEIIEKFDDVSNNSKRESQCYLLQQRIVGLALNDLRVALAPFLYCIDLPFWPPARADQLTKSIHSILKGDDPISLAMVRLALTKRDIICSEDYLHFSLVNDPNVLLVHDQTLKVDLCEEIFPSFELATVGLNATEYARVTKSFGWERKASDIEVLPDSLMEFFRHRGEENFISLVDPVEVAVKAYIRSEAPRAQKQGLADLVHSEVTRALRDSGKALRLIDIQRITGLYGLNLVPERLPPGKILSYAPSPRFLNKEMAYYVLDEWMESTDRTKGMIVRDRVVTPQEPKDFKLENSKIAEAIDENSTFSDFGIINAEQISRDIAFSLPGKPTELYYLRLIQDMVEDYLSKSCASLGKSLFLDTAAGIDRPKNISAVKWRRLVLEELLQYPESLMDAIDRVPEEHRATLQILL